MRKIFCCSLIIVLSLLPDLSFAKTYWKRGMWVGATAGGIVLGTSFGVATAVSPCDPNESDMQICGAGWATALSFGVGVVGAVIGGVIGGGIGALIGSAFKVEEDTVIAPFIVPQKNGLFGGLGFRRNF